MAIPAPPALTKTKRYIPAGARRIVWVPTIAVPSAPTSVEINAGTDLTAEIAADGLTGFTTTGSDTPVPDYGSQKIGTIPGTTTLDSGSIKTYASSDSVDARSLLTDGLNGFVVEFPEGIPATGGKLNVFTCRVRDTNVDQNAAGDPATITTGMSVSAVQKNVSVPTA